MIQLEGESSVSAGIAGIARSVNGAHTVELYLGDALYQYVVALHTAKLSCAVAEEWSEMPQRDVRAAWTEQFSPLP